MFISGNRYGRPALDFARYRQFGFDYAAAPSRPIGGRPRVTPVAGHPARGIPYSHVPELVEKLIGHGYQLTHMVRAYSPEARNFYDVQDGFYLPFGSFDRVERPGPNVLIYGGNENRVRDLRGRPKPLSDVRSTELDPAPGSVTTAPARN